MHTPDTLGTSSTSKLATRTDRKYVWFMHHVMPKGKHGSNVQATVRSVYFPVAKTRQVRGLLLLLLKDGWYTQAIAYNDE
jgi:hypothetical protein